MIIIVLIILLLIIGAITGVMFYRRYRRQKIQATALDITRKLPSTKTAVLRLRKPRNYKFLHHVPEPRYYNALSNELSDAPYINKFDDVSLWNQFHETPVRRVYQPMPRIEESDSRYAMVESAPRYDQHEARRPEGIPDEWQRYRNKPHDVDLPERSTNLQDSADYKAPGWTFDNNIPRDDSPKTGLSYSPVAKRPKNGNSQEHSDDSLHITVVSYNVRVDVDRKPHDWNSRAHHVLANIRRMKPDILCLQESSPKVRKYLLSNFHHFISCGAQRGIRSTEAVHILLHKKIWKVEKETTYVFNEKDPIRCSNNVCDASTVFNDVKDKHPRIFTYVILTHKKTGNRLHVFNTHLSLNFEIQRSSLIQLAAFIRQQVNEKEAVIVTGDFNSHYAPTEANTPLSQMMLCGFKDAHGLKNDSTFGDFVRVNPNTNKLDYILYRGALQLVRSGISDYVNKYRPSDHEAVFSEFAFTQNT